MKCSVYACYQPVKARHLCNRHYRLWLSRRRLPPHDGRAGAYVSPADDPVVCHCYTPVPDAIGECGKCGRLVVTFAHANQERFQAMFPEEWDRATKLGLTPGRGRKKKHESVQDPQAGRRPRRVRQG